MQRVTWIILGLCAVVGLVAACAPLWIPGPPEMELRALRAGLTAYPMFAIRDANATQAIPPLRPTQDPLYQTGARYPLAWDCNNAYLDTTWPSAGTNNIDWTDYDACFSYAGQYTVTLGSGTIISQPVAIDIPPQFLSSGTYGGYYSDPHLPAWLEADCLTTFTVGGDAYNAIRYNNATCLNYIKNFITAAATRYETNPQLNFVRVYVGHEGEAQPNKVRSGAAYTPTILLEAAETVASCAAFQFWVQSLATHAKDEFPNIPVTLMSATDPCSSKSGDVFRRENFTAWAASGVYIGPSLHSVTGDRGDAAEKTGNTNAGWKKLTTGLSASTLGLPMWYEFGENAALDQAYAHEYGDDLWGYGFWAALSGAAAKGDIVANNYTWIPYRSRDSWDVADYWVSGNRRLWVVLRDNEYPSYNYSANYGAAGFQGDYTKNGSILTPAAYPQACSQVVGPNAINWRATVIARQTEAVALGYTMNSTTVPCSSTALPTPKATLQATPGTDTAADTNMRQRLFNRQARRIPANTNLRVAVDSSWAYYGTTQAAVTVTLTYLDVGVDNITVALPPSTAWTFARTNTGNWLRKSWVSPASVPITNYLSCRQTTGGVAAGCFIYILVENTDAYIHEVYADVGGAPASTATPGPTDPSLRTNTPTATSTPPSITTTPQPTATRWPGYYLDSPMDTAPAENWTGYTTASSHAIATATADCVTAGCWHWVAPATYGWARVYWGPIPTPYAAEYTSTDKSLHISFDLKMIATPAAAGQTGLLSMWAGGGSATGTVLVYWKPGAGTLGPWGWGTQGGTFWWDAPDNVWQHVDIYADQQPPGYKTARTPEPGELPYRVSVNGTPIATPTGNAPSWEVISTALPINSWRWNYAATGPYQYAVDGLVIQQMQCAAGTCPSPTPVGTPLVWTVTPSPTATYTPSRTPTVSPTPTSTSSPTPTRTPTVTMTPVRTIPCPTMAVTPDGDLVEWVGGFAAELNAASAAYIAPPNWTITPVPTVTGTPPTSTATVTGTPPTATPVATATATPDAQLLLYCAHTTGFLALAGIITDTTILTPTSDLEFGDAVEIGIDGANDRLVQPHLDDRDILLSPGERILNYGTPLSATVGTSITVGSWRFEALIPVSELGTGNLTAGKILGFIFGYYDRATALERRYMFTTGWYGGVMQ